MQIMCFTFDGKGFFLYTLLSSLIHVGVTVVGLLCLLRFCSWHGACMVCVWQPPPASSWNSDPIGYQVWYAPLQLQKERTDINYHRETVFYPDTHIHLNKLMKGFSYELKVAAYGTYGLGPFTVPYDIFVGEAGKMI